MSTDRSVALMLLSVLVAAVFLAFASMGETDARDDQSASHRARLDSRGPLSVGPPPNAMLASSSAVHAQPSDAGVTITLPAALHAALTSFHALLEQEPVYQRWLACRRDCEALLEELVVGALAGYWHLVESDAFGFGLLIAGMNEEQVLQFVENRLTQSNAVDRVALLAVLDRTPGLRRRELPDSLYERIGERTPPEARLILARHDTLPISDPGVVTEIAELATDETTQESLRYQAISALGHAETSHDLMATVAGLLERDADTALLDRGATASARCGWECRDALGGLFGSPVVDVRTAAYRALAAVRDSEERARMRAYLEANGSLSTAAAEDLEERFAQDRTMRLIDEFD